MISRLSRLSQNLVEAIRLRNKLVAASKWPLIIAGSLFIGGATLSFFQLGQLSIELRPIFLAPVAILGVPITIALNAEEHRTVGRLLNVTIPRHEAIRVAVLGTAANLAPLPGASMVRISDLYARGLAGRQSILGTALAGIVSLAVAGGAIASLTLLPVVLRSVAGAIAVAAVSVSVLISWSLKASPVGLIAVEVGILSANAFRLCFILLALGFSPKLDVLVVMAAGYTLTAAIGIFPGGLGFREGILGYAAAAMGLAAGGGFAASAVDRLIGLIVHAPLAFRIGRKSESGPQPIRSDVG